MDRNYKLAKRRYVIGGVVLTVVVLFIIRLFALQILSDDYRKNADSNAFLKKIQYPSRGVIYDRTIGMINCWCLISLLMILRW